MDGLSLIQMSCLTSPQMSREEYIPKTSEDSSEGTDTSEVLDLVDKIESTLRFPELGKMADVDNGCLSLTELNKASSKQTLNIGHSPSRKGSKSKRRFLKSVSDTTTRTK